MNEITAVFIGGPYDGKVLQVPDPTQRLRVIVPPKDDLTKLLYGDEDVEFLVPLHVTYRRRVWRPSGRREFNIYAPENVSDDDALRMLLQFYVRASYAGPIP